MNFQFMVFCKKDFYMKNLFITGCFLLLAFCSIANESILFFRIIPQPQKIELLKGRGVKFGELKYIILQDSGKIPVLGKIMDKLPRGRKKGKGIVLSLSGNGVPESEEGYVLEVGSHGVTIHAKGNTGLFYGCQTLEQLLEDSRDLAREIPAMKITDYPKLAYRAVHFDTKHHLDRMEYYYAEIDKLARYKVNAIIWELEDKLRYTRRPEVAAPNAISKQEMKALCRYANDRHIDISPLVQGLGHAGFILKHHWELRENPASDWEFCPAEPRTYEVQFDLYRDALEAMPYGKYLHVGGDEITAIGIDGRCKATGKNAFELQMMWLKQVCGFAVEQGRIPIFWDDMPLKYAGVWGVIQGNWTGEELEKRWNPEKLDKAIDLFPKECVYMRWNYGDATKPAHVKLLNWYRDKGLKVMGATAAAAGDSPFLPREESKIGCVRGFSRLVAENGLEGILATAWDDGSPHTETVWRGFVAQGEFGWNPKGRSISEFKAAHGQREFGFLPADSLMIFLDELEKAAFFFDGALVTSGRRNPAWGTGNFTLLDLPKKDKPGEWNVKYKNKIEQSRQALVRYEKIKKGIEKAKNEALRNRYTLEVYEQTNHLLAFPARLIVALSIYDQESSSEKKEEALKEVYQVCQYFKDMRKALVDVYSQTRFMENPGGYISDMNHHNHLAAKSDNSDWLFLYELPMVNKTIRWVQGTAPDINFRIF